MGQQEVYDFLKRHKGRWWSSKDIAARLKASLGSVTNNLTKLRKRNEISFRMSEEKSSMFLYRME
ncbi:hypothetical protein JXC34_05590 [Candidatus Woesearchaeota archaeon]|nr:hypothetical protein [Candidatus Woesearchaeota archaeon]